MTKRSPGNPPSDAPEPAAADDDLAEDDLDLSDIDAALLARSGADDDEDLADEGGSVPRRGRSSWISGGVVVLGIYLMFSMWPDFRYWIQSRTPVDLGHAADFVGPGGEVPPGYHDEYVVMEGTPDVQHAARATTEKAYVGYLRITEGGGQLFAAVPRSRDQQAANTFEGRYEGRMKRLGSDQAYPWIQQFFEQQALMRTHDVEPAALTAALGGDPSAGFTVDAPGGAIRVGARERVRLVVAQAEATVQLGKTTFRKEADADAAVAGLGLPFVRLQRKNPAFRTYVVRVPAERHEEIRAQLLADVDVPADRSADPKVGAVVLPRSATFTAAADSLRLSGDQLSFAYADNTTAIGYDVDGDTLVERSAHADGTASIAMGSLRAVRIETPIDVDPDGYLIEVGADPDSEFPAGIGWLLVLGLVLVNSLSLWLAWRRS